MTTNPDDQQPTDDEGLLQTLRRLRVNADKGREPDFLPARTGTRRYSVKALAERIITAFVEEHGQDSRALLDADTQTKKLQLVLGVTDYVLAAESIQITNDEKAQLMAQVYTELFTYGPLDRFFLDESVTTISVEGSEKLAVRYGHGELTSMGPLFEDDGHLRKVIRRLLLDANMDFNPGVPIIEMGLMVGTRRACVSIVQPPVTFQLTADIRLHPSEPPALEGLLEKEFITPEAVTFLRALAQSAHGVMVIGDTESGKTTMLGVLGRLMLPEQQGQLIAVERAAGIHLPAGATRLVVEYPHKENPGATFYDQLQKALERQAGCVMLDEIRADELQAVALMLTCANPPRQVWAFRGPANMKRLIAALGMLARRADPYAGEGIVHALYDRLPFVVAVRRRKDRLQLHSVGEWQFAASADYPDYVELMTMGWERVESTGRRPLRPLGLPDDFWNNG